MEVLRLEKRERNEEVDSKEGDDDDEDSELLSERDWWRLERRSSIDKCFFCNAASAAAASASSLDSSIVFANCEQWQGEVQIAKHNATGTRIRDGIEVWVV